MTSQKIDIEHFLELSANIPVIDVRSPMEYGNGHIPDAINIPLFDNDERAAVGTKFKKEGRLPAILEGLRLSAPSIHMKLEKALGFADGGKLLVHCWRGGMRSEAMAWLFSLGDIETMVLEGGYKSFRNHIIGSFSEKRELFVLGGLTGSSKTQILQLLKNNGHQILDLEGLANHKGSAFGALGQLPQPSTEQFANNLYNELKNLKPELPMWVEDESRNIGTVFLPDNLYQNMQNAKTIVLIMNVSTRMPRLLEEYSIYPPESLKTSLMKISRRLGGDNTKEAIKAIDNGNIARAIEISLSYYDKSYRYSLNKKDRKNLVFVETDTDDILINCRKVLEASTVFA